MRSLEEHARAQEAYGRTGASLAQFAEAMRRLTAGPPLSVAEIERRCQESLRLSQRRRCERSPHPWPERGHRLASWLVALGAVVAVMWLLAWLGDLQPLGVA